MTNPTHSALSHNAVILSERHQRESKDPETLHIAPTAHILLTAFLTLAALTTLSPAARAQVQSNLPGAGFDTPGTVANPVNPATPTIHVYSRETIVDVTVTDDKGQPVTGLKKSDFAIEEDGKPQPIRSFSEYDKTTPPAPPRTLPPNTYTNSTTLPANGPVQIFLFDVAATPPAVMEKAKKYIADGLRSMPAGTQVAVFELSQNKGPLLLQGVTTDTRTAAAAVDNLDVEWFRDKSWPNVAIVGSYQIADYVAAIHGRKNVIWIRPGSPPPFLHDGGYSWSPPPDPKYDLWQQPNSSPNMTDVHRMMDLYDIFTREQIAVSWLDPSGVHRLRWNTLMAQAVADGTGGAPPDNSNDFKGTIAKIVDYTAHGYTLSYVPPRPDEDGHYHPITIKLDRAGLHLNYRPGYNDEEPDPPDADLKQGMIESRGPMRLGAVPATQILFDLKIDPASPKPQLTPASIAKPKSPHTKGTPYDTTFTFDPKQIALTQNPDDTRTASIEIDLGAFDFYGNLVAARSQTFKISVTPTQYESFYRKPIHFPLAIDLPPGQLTLRAGLFDTTGNKSGTLEVPFTVAKPKPAK